ncbi:MAG: hypothetical protein AB2L14_03835 [Candidatus Xenobiia bacterium LiM19]
MKFFDGGKKELMELLDYAGISQESRWKLHHRLETKYPDKHKAILESLGLKDDEIAHIRECAIKPEAQA